MSDRQKGLDDGERQGLAGLLFKSGPFKEAYEHFNKLRDKIEKAIGPFKTHTVDDIWIGIVNGQFQLWMQDNSVIITEIIEYPRCKALRIFLAAGKMDEVLDTEKQLCQYAKRHGCKFITQGGGRTGWEKVCLGLGYQRASPLMIKDLSNG